ncbi:Uncharacterized protein HZ326_29510 [Fusarium oxysporum f. sp. albedinis]|nr:Uncharacterized protein HZ326_29510 [Fusarium oxysporum f. sp. albedinis]
MPLSGWYWFPRLRSTESSPQCQANDFACRHVNYLYSPRPLISNHSLPTTCMKMKAGLSFAQVVMRYIMTQRLLTQNTT